MYKEFTEDELFKKALAEFAPGGLDKKIIFNYATSLMGSVEPEVVCNILNIIKASVVSNMSFTKCYQHIAKVESIHVGYDMLRKLTFFIAAEYLMTIDQLGSIIKPERDFVAEVAAEKYNIPVANVTATEKEALLADSDEVYSITDTPVDNWDEYFFNVCRQAARNSKCLSRRIGAVLVKDKSIISTGYNSPPRGVPSCDLRWTLDPHFIAKYKDKIVVPLDPDKPICPRYSLGAKSGEMLDICAAGHAEENAILNAAWHGISTKGATLFMTCGIPCFRCVVKIINAGIKEIVVTGISFYDDNAEFLLNNSEVKVRFYKFDKKI